jgi:rod shape-determining protein MreD
MSFEPIGPTPAGRAGKLALLTLPFVIGLVCVLLSFVPLSAIFGADVAPAFGLMAVYYWAVHRPDVFPPYAVFALGLLYDLLSAGPLGLWALVYVVIYGIVLTQRQLFVGRAFTLFWSGFLVSAMMTALFAWILASFYFGKIMSPIPVLTQMAATVALFPLFAKLFELLQQRLLVQG